MAVATTAKHPKELQTRNEECGTSEEQTWKRKYAAIKRKVEEVEQMNEGLCSRLQKIRKLVKESEAENGALQKLLNAHKVTDTSSSTGALKPSSATLVTPTPSKPLPKPSLAVSRTNSSKTNRSPKRRKQTTLGLADDDFV